MLLWLPSKKNYFVFYSNGCHRCVVIYEKHKNVLQYKESECGDLYDLHINPAAMPIQMRSILKSDHRGGAHPNSNGHSRLSSSDQFLMRSNDDSDNCSKHFNKTKIKTKKIKFRKENFFFSYHFLIIFLLFITSNIFCVFFTINFIFLSNFHLIYFIFTKQIIRN